MNLLFSYSARGNYYEQSVDCNLQTTETRSTCDKWFMTDVLD